MLLPLNLCDFTSISAKNMKIEIVEALNAFTVKYLAAWKQQTGLPPASDELYGIPSPCVVRTGDDIVYWEPQPFPLADESLERVEKALDIKIQSDLHHFYTSQLAGDIAAEFDGLALNLIQVWSEEDFTRLQENLIGHLVTQKRLKLSPTLFIATLDSDLDMVTVCNLTGEVLVETFGSKKRRTIAPNLTTFVVGLIPRITA